MKEKTGAIDVITGCMFSGKTTTLISRLDSFSRAGYKIQAFKPSGDTRYDQNQLVSHPPSDLRHPATPIPDNEPSKIIAELKAGMEVVGIDEVQFFSSEISDVCETLVTQGYRVIVAGLETDFRRLSFGSTQDLIRMANEMGCSVYRLETPCAICGHPAHYTQRLVDGKPASVDDPVRKVGKDDYEPRCDKCHEIKYQPSPSYDSARISRFFPASNGSVWPDIFSMSSGSI